MNIFDSDSNEVLLDRREDICGRSCSPFLEGRVFVTQSEI